jgi:predicted ATPase with chaperone activity
VVPPPASLRRHDGRRLRASPLYNDGGLVDPDHMGLSMSGASGGSGSEVAEGTVVEGLGIRRSLVEGLTLKTLYHLGEASLHELASQLCINRSIVDGIFQRLRKELMVQAVGMSVGVHQVTLTASGRTRAAELLALDGYVGPAPVSLTDYVNRVNSQSVRELDVHPDDVTSAFDDLVLDHGTLAQLGTAMVSGRAIFLYGPPGTGKTTVAERLSELIRRESVWIPYAVEVDGQIITVFDSHVHETVEQNHDAGTDPRWVRCRRPRVMVGGELTIDMLDLQFNPLSRYYTAPVQMRANNGFLIVDDFGRQRIQPAELLNRWVVPLDRRIDYLSLAGGKKIHIPFDLFVVFATNLDPALVVEEAFLRRIQTKVRLGSIEAADFHEIFRRACAEMGLAYDPQDVDEVVSTIATHYGQPLRACYPRDLLNQIAWRARYEQVDPVVTRESLAAACGAYFLSRDRPAVP